MLSREAPRAGSHLSSDLMARLLAAPEELRQVLAHLAACCPDCARQLEDLERMRRDVRHPDDVGTLTEGEGARELLSRLDGLAFEARLDLVSQHSEFHTPGVAHELLRRSGELAADSPGEAADLAELGLRITAHLGGIFDPARVHDLQGLGFAHLGNALRMLSEPRAATGAFSAAHGLLARGTGDPALEAECLELEALSCFDGQQFDEALELLERARCIHAPVEGAPADPHAAAPHRVGRALAHLAWVQYHLGRTEIAVATLQEAAAVIDRARDPRLALAVHHGLVRCAAALGWSEEAATQLVIASELAAAHGSDAERLRLRQVRARLDLVAGDSEGAGAALEEIFREATRRLLGIDALQAAIELVTLYVERNDADALARLGNVSLALAFAPDLQRAGVPLLALVAFSNACESRCVDLKLLRSLAGFLERFRHASLSWWSDRRIDLSEGLSRVFPGMLQ